MKYELTVIKELETTLSSISEKDTQMLAKSIENSNSIFLAGCGRSGLMIKAFAMRLMHMGKRAYVVGETTTPAIKKGDLLIIASGSGETESLVAMAKKCVRIGIPVATVTIFPDAQIGKMADTVVVIDAPTAKSEKTTKMTSIQPMGSLFEQSLLLFFDSLIVRLMQMENTTSQIMFELHANLE